MVSFHELALLLLELAVYSSAMLVLFRFRDRLGIGTFYCALGSLHFLETYLAATVYVQVAPGVVFSPGSVILFSGKLALLLLVYIQEDAATVRQPIYGLFLGNLITAAMVPFIRMHTASVDGADVSLLGSMGGLMVWGTFLLFVDCLLVILLYERLGKARWLRQRSFLRLWLTLSVVLTFDQLCFAPALYLLEGVPPLNLIGGWVGKMVVAGIYSGILAGYLRWVEGSSAHSVSPLGLGDVFQVLTYREKYEALQQQAWRDSLTGLQHRGRLEQEGISMIDSCRRQGMPLSMLMIDVDNFKAINDLNGHKAGDMVLRHIGHVLGRTLRRTDFACRYGGDEFVVLAPGTSRENALDLAELLRECISAADVDVLAVSHSDEPVMPEVSVSIGVATFPDQGQTLDDIMRAADKQVYRAKESGRDRVMIDAS